MVAAWRKRRDAAFCHTCLKAFQSGMLTSSSLMLMIFAVFVQAVKRISYWKCFHNCGRLEVSSLAYLDCNFFATTKQLRTWRLSRIESTLMMSRNDFNLHRVDLYRNDFVLKWPNSVVWVTNNLCSSRQGSRFLWSRIVRRWFKLFVSVCWFPVNSGS